MLQSKRKKKKHRLLGPCNIYICWCFYPLDTNIQFTLLPTMFQGNPNNHTGLDVLQYIPATFDFGSFGFGGQEQFTFWSCYDQVMQVSHVKAAACRSGSLCWFLQLLVWVSAVKQLPTKELYELGYFLSPNEFSLWLTDGSSCICSIINWHLQQVRSKNKLAIIVFYDANQARGTKLWGQRHFPTT